MASTKCNNGGPAFPSPVTSEEEYLCPGMSLRDYFAANNMAALIRRSAVTAYAQGLAITAERHETSQDRILAQTAYEMADAMLAERDKA